MTLLPFAADRLRPVLKLAALTLAIAIPSAAVSAQNPAPASSPPEQKAIPDQKSVPESEQTFTINYATAPSDLNDLQTALRNMLPRARMYALESQDAIVIRATAEDLENAKRLIGELDRPRKAWRVTYTITDIDSGKRAEPRQVTLIVIAGTRSTIKQGNRLPLLTGTQKGSSADQNTEVQYIDVGLNIDANIDGGRLRSRIEQSGVADEKSGFGVQDPVVHQSLLEGSSNLDPGKPVMLGSLDIPGTTHRQEIEVTAEPLR
ncbi:MAG TPA: secretin N-terminal domain-containing protein [Terracidiphilus sp.]|jgi:type II secretory pathway component GspD/PulD (secretin)|nr:secretin N-terminal domain-containing protein [Terracidiphilus sp.]